MGTSAPLPNPPATVDPATLTAPASAPAAHKQAPSTHENIFERLWAFVKDAPKLVVLYEKASPQIKTTMTLVFQDVMKSVADVEGEVTATETGNIVGAVTLAPATLAALKQTYMDAKNGEQTMVADLKALGISI